MGGAELGSYEDFMNLMNVWKILSPGGSFYRILRGSEVLWGSMTNRPKAPGGSAKEKPLTCVWGGRGRGGGAGFDECIEDSGSGRLDLSCFTRV